MPAPFLFSLTEKPWPVSTGDHPGRLRLRLGAKAATLTDSGMTSPGDLHRLDVGDLAGPGNLLVATGLTLGPWPPPRPPSRTRLDTGARPSCWPTATPTARRPVTKPSITGVLALRRPAR